jgi:uncharacterized membrane protein YgdD (TMEM256/DUF423 family)
MKTIIRTIGISGALAVVLGAFGAHGIKPLISDTSYSNYQTAVLYHFIHTLALGILLVLPKENNRIKSISYLLFTTGITCFSGSLYVISTRELTGFQWALKLGPVTPLGGLLFILGWGTIAAYGFHKTIKV